MPPYLLFGFRMLIPHAMEFSRSTRFPVHSERIEFKHLRGQTIETPSADPYCNIQPENIPSIFWAYHRWAFLYGGREGNCIINISNGVEFGIFPEIFHKFAHCFKNGIAVVHPGTHSGHPGSSGQFSSARITSDRGRHG